MEKFSQNSEQEHILKHFEGRTGRFLDIGAFDGRTFSNVYALSQLGWEGVCIEPSPTAFVALMNTYTTFDEKGNPSSFNPNVRLVNAAMSYKETGLVDFADSKGDAISTTDAAHEVKWSKVVKFQHIYVNTVTIREILRIFGEKFDFISLDVEGTNLEILQTFPLELMSPSLICIEHELKFDEIFNFCKGYKEVHRNGENIILKK